VKSEWRLANGDLRFAIYDLRFTICDLRFAIYDLRFAICDLRFTIYDLRLINACFTHSSFAIRQSPFVTRHLSFITHHELEGRFIMPDNIVKDEVTILIAEDDDGHAELIKGHLEEAGVRNKIIRFHDGLELWDFLTGKSDEPNIQHNHSYLILLDIRMPRMDGLEVLKKIKADSEMKNIPVIMLTTTDDPREIEECYNLGCNCYITKPIDFNRFTETLKRVGLFIMILRVSKINGDSIKNHDKS
jgi:CheY-like chemotaxis protein